MQVESSDQIVIYNKGNAYRAFKFPVTRHQGRWLKAGPTTEITEHGNQEDMKLAAFMWEEEGDTQLVGSLTIFPVIDGWKAVFRGWHADNIRPMSPERIQELIKKIGELDHD